MSIGGVLMSLSTVVVALKGQLLRGFDLPSQVPVPVSFRNANSKDAHVIGE